MMPLRNPPLVQPVEHTVEDKRVFNIAAILKAATGLDIDPDAAIMSLRDGLLTITVKDTIAHQ